LHLVLLPIHFGSYTLGLVGHPHYLSIFLKVLDRFAILPTFFCAVVTLGDLDFFMAALIFFAGMVFPLFRILGRSFNDRIGAAPAFEPEPSRSVDISRFFAKISV